jgi:hypothetical protein
MLRQLATKTNKSPKPPRAYPGAPAESECTQQPPLPEPLYEPYDQKGLHDTSYKPYSEKAALPEPPYEPYKGI